MCLAAGACKDAAGVIPGRPSVPRPALFAHGDHQDIRKGWAQRRATLQRRVYENDCLKGDFMLKFPAQCVCSWTPIEELCRIHCLRKFLFTLNWA